MPLVKEELTRGWRWTKGGRVGGWWRWGVDCCCCCSGVGVMRREGGRTANQLQMSAAEREIKRVKDGERGGTEGGGG